MVAPQSQNIHKLPQKRISQKSPNRWKMVYFYVLCSKNTLMKPVGYRFYFHYAYSISNCCFSTLVKKWQTGLVD